MTDAFSTPAEHAFDHPEIEAAVEAGPSSLGDALAGVPIDQSRGGQKHVPRASRMRRSYCIRPELVCAMANVDRRV
jgi:hypothetical protein